MICSTCITCFGNNEDENNRKHERFLYLPYCFEIELILILNLEVQYTPSSDIINNILLIFNRYNLRYIDLKISYKNKLNITCILSTPFLLFDFFGLYVCTIKNHLPWQNLNFFIVTCIAIVQRLYQVNGSVKQSMNTNLELTYFNY